MKACTIAANTAAVAGATLEQNRIPDAPDIGRILDTDLLDSLENTETAAAEVEHLRNEAQSAMLRVLIEGPQNFLA